MSKKRESGITLIALVVTIVILIVLAVISINVFFREDGINKKVQTAEEMHRLGEEKERLELVKPKVAIENTGRVEIEDYINELIREGITKKEDIEENTDGSKQLITDKGYDVNVKQDGENNNIIITVDGKVKDLPVKIVDVKLQTNTNHIKVDVEVRRGEGATYKYYYKKEGEAYKLEHEGRELSYTIENLEQDVNYTIKVEVTNKNGTVYKEVIGRTREIIAAEGVIRFSNLNWTNGKASIVVTKSDTVTNNLKIQYRVNTENYQIIASGGTISNLSLNDVITVRLWDETNYGSTASLTVTDTTPPAITVTKVLNSTNSIEVTAKATDSQAGMPATIMYNYYIKKANDINYSTTPTATNTTGNYTFTGLVQNTSYDVKVTAKDLAGNIGIGNLTNVITGEVEQAVGNIRFSELNWTNGKASVTVSKTGENNYQIQYKVNTGSYITIANGGGISDLSLNDVVSVRLWDGTNYGSTASLTVTDTIPPAITVVRVSNSTNSIEVRAKATDSQAGVPENITYNYYIKKTADASYPANATATNTTGSYTFTGLLQNTSYDVKITAKDIAGNTGTGTLSNTTTGTVTAATGAITFENLSWNNGKASVTVTKGVSVASSLSIQYKVNTGNYVTITSGGTISGLSLNDVVTVRLWDGTNYGSTASLTVADTIAPNITVTKGLSSTNSIGVTAKATDAQAGMPESITYNYYIKKTADTSYPTSATATNTTGSYIFTGLLQNTSYDVKITAKDIAGNTGTGTLSNTTTGTVTAATGAITFGNLSWNNGKASVTVTKGASVAGSLSIQYKVNTGNYVTITSGGTISGLSLNDVVTVRLWDGTNYGSTASLTVVDITVPNKATITLSSTNNTVNGVIATVSQSDGQSGIDITKCRWVYNTTSENIGTSESSYPNTFNETSQTLTLKATTLGTYYLHVLSIDKAGNKIETRSNAITANYIDNELIASPKISDGMIPVYWNGSNWIKTTVSDSKWYNYTNKQWANVVLGDATFNGDVLDESKSYSQLVWIPRFAYKITSNWHSTTTGTIDVVFVGTDNKGRDGTLYNGTYATATTGITSGDAMKNFVVEPAFDYGATKLEGFWIGKFESSHTGCTTAVSTGQATFTGKEVMQVKPNVTSWRYLTIGDAFTTCLNMNRASNPYGLNTSDNVVDPHMVKNTEWGAVAYLSKSKYGKETEEVYINNSSDYITGNAGNTASASSVAGITNAYNTTNGQKASTTGNIYGVYDMSGGNWERVAAYVNNGHDNLNTYGKSVVDGDAKYKEVYEQGATDTQELNYGKAATKYGDAVYETSNGYNSSSASWYSDCAKFVNTNNPFFRRGGYRGGSIVTTTDMGVFAFDITTGEVNTYYGFRVAVPVF